MRVNQPVTNRERSFSDVDRIVSTTNLGGKILYANSAFFDIAGYSSDEMLGQPHNLIRHPDMPPVAFSELWSTVKRGKAWMGIVKNRCKNGDHYWVDAFVTPVMEGGQVIGYQSVRRKPSAALVGRASKLYGITTDRFAGVKNKITGLPVWLKTYLTTVLALLGFWLLTELLGGWLLALPIMLVILGVALFMLFKPLSDLAAECKSECGSDIACAVYGGSGDEISRIKTLLHFKDSLKETILWRIKESVDTLTASMEGVEGSTSRTLEKINQLNLELDQVATAMHEMVATVNEVASNSTQTAEATKESEETVVAGQASLNSAVISICEVKDQMESNMENINRLVSSSEEIGKIIEVINNIAEQTNLLALNAAIEAARAGDQGRGFAVVADEVRQLAFKTQNATENIQKMIMTLQNTSQQSVAAIMQSQQNTMKSAESSTLANENMSAIESCISQISDMSLQIATATEEQSAVSEEINRNLHNIKEASESNLSSVTNIVSEVGSLKKSANRLSQMISQFGNV